MTRKRYNKLMRAFLTDLHTYSKMVEGQVGYDGKPLKRTSMKREKLSPIHPNWDSVGSYAEGWAMIAPVWDTVRESLNKMKGAE